MITQNNKWLQARSHYAVKSLHMCTYACMRRCTNGDETTNIFTYTLNTSILRIAAHTPACAPRMLGREDRLASNLNLLSLWTERVVGWLTRPWKPFSRSGQSEPERQTEWVWERNVFLCVCVCVWLRNQVESDWVSERSVWACWWLPEHARLHCCLSLDL